MKIGDKYGCLTILDLGEEYKKSIEYIESNQELVKIQADIDKYINITDINKKREIILLEVPNSTFASNLKRTDNINEIYDEFLKSRNFFSQHKIESLQRKMQIHYKCQCTCGKVHYYNIETIKTNPKYCFYPVFISTRFSYSTRANNATYQKHEKYKFIENVSLVEKRSYCIPLDQYCSLWNKYKIKQQNKTISSANEKLYTIEEWDNNGNFVDKYEVYSISHLEALKKIYPNCLFELCNHTDARNWIRKVKGEDFNFKVNNHYGNSSQNRSRYYKLIQNSEISSHINN